MERSRRMAGTMSGRSRLGTRSASARRIRLALGAAVLAGSTLAVAASPPSWAATSTPNPNGVLKYGVDLNETFSGTFDPGASTNDCSYTEYSALYDSLLAPGNAKVSPLLRHQLHHRADLHHLPHPARGHLLQRHP